MWIAAAPVCTASVASAFGGAQIEIYAPLFIGETRQAVQFIDLAGGKNR
jgi:hypothetical protein